MRFEEVEPAGKGIKEVAESLVRRLGLKRKDSSADHAELLLEMLKFRKAEYPLDMEEIAKILKVSVPQAYREISKWKELGLVEVVKMKVGEAYARGYMLTGPTANRLMDRVESSFKSFLRRTRRLAKELDDLMAVEKMK